MKTHLLKIQNPMRLAPVLSLAFKLAVATVFTLVIYSVRANAQLEYDSSQLLLKNADQVTEIVKKKIQKANEVLSQQQDDDSAEGLAADPQALKILKAGLRIAFSRPDQDGLRGSLFSRLRRELSDLNSLDPVLAELTKESIDALKDKNTSPKVQTTYVILLENMIAELKPEISTNPAFKKIIEDVRDSKIEISSKTKSYQKLKSMTVLTSPSMTAEGILPKNPPKKK